MSAKTSGTVRRRTTRLASGTLTGLIVLATLAEEGLLRDPGQSADPAVTNTAAPVSTAPAAGPRPSAEAPRPVEEEPAP